MQNTKEYQYQMLLKTSTTELAFTSGSNAKWYSFFEGQLGSFFKNTNTLTL
jgi:hypothetical protein